MMRDRAALLDAVAHLERLPRQPEYRLAIAEAQFRLAIAPGTGPEEAMERLRRAIAEDPFLPKLYLHLGRLLHRAGRYRAAVGEYREALRLAPGSRRTYLLMALALLDLGKPERAIGQDLLDALSRSSRDELAAALAALDALAGGAGGPGGTDGATLAGPRRRRRGSGPTGRVAPDTWRPVLLEQLAQPKPLPAWISACVDAARDGVATGDGVAGFATACLLMLVGGEPPAAVRRLMAADALAREPDHPAAVLLRTAVDLAEIGDFTDFVKAAGYAVERRLVPAELACWLHFARHVAAPGPVLAAIRLLDAYPEAVRELDCFRELRLAILDDHARQAWREGRLDLARLLWQETVALDPHRVTVAVNLALLAARTRSVEEYGPAWNRVAELLYLHSAGSGDVQLLLDERVTMHLALSQQSARRHCGEAASGEITRDQLAAWIDDRDTLEVWLREWDLYYLNARLRFRSPVHLLGVPRDAPPEALSGARDVLVRHLHGALGELPWAGVKVFCRLACARVDEALAAARAQAERGADPHYEQEKALADALLDEAWQRALVLRRLTDHLTRLGAARYLELGVAIARRQLALPLDALQRLCVDRGLIGAGEQLADIFAADLIQLAATWRRPEPRGAAEYGRRLAALDRYLALAPHLVGLHALRCQLLFRADRRAEAYAAAVVALDLPVPPGPAGQAEQIRGDLVEMVDAIGEHELPAEARQLALPAEPDNTIEEMRAVVRRLPRSAPPRTCLADLLVRLGGPDRVQQAVDLLEEGLRLALVEAHRNAFVDRLASVPGAAAASAIARYLREVEDRAVGRVREAVARYRRAPDTPGRVELRDLVRTAAADVSAALALARRAGRHGEADAGGEAARLTAALSALRRLEQRLDQ